MSLTRSIWFVVESPVQNSDWFSLLCSKIFVRIVENIAFKHFPSNKRRDIGL